MLKAGRGLSGTGGVVSRAMASVSGGETSPTGKSAEKEEMFEMEGLKGNFNSFFFRESTFSKRPTYFQIISSEGCMRLFDCESIIDKG